MRGDIVLTKDGKKECVVYILPLKNKLYTSEGNVYNCWEVEVVNDKLKNKLYTKCNNQIKEGSLKHMSTNLNNNDQSAEVLDDEQYTEVLDNTDEAELEQILLKLLQEEEYKARRQKFLDNIKNNKIQIKDKKGNELEIGDHIILPNGERDIVDELYSDNIIKTCNGVMYSSYMVEKVEPEYNPVKGMTLPIYVSKFLSINGQSAEALDIGIMLNETKEEYENRKQKFLDNVLSK